MYVVVRVEQKGQTLLQMIVFLCFVCGSVLESPHPNTCLCGKKAPVPPGNTMRKAEQRQKPPEQLPVNQQMSPSKIANAKSFAFVQMRHLLLFDPRTRWGKTNKKKKKAIHQREPQRRILLAWLDRRVMGVTYMDYGKINDTNNYNGDSKNEEGEAGEEMGWSGSKKMTQKTWAQNSSNKECRRDLAWWR